MSLLVIVQEFLTREKSTFELITTTSTQEDLQRLKDEPFDAVVADYRMPKIDGLELLKTLHDEGNSISFIIFTCQGREEMAMRALNLGTDYYLMEGDDPKSLNGELLHIINRVVAHR